MRYQQGAYIANPIVFSVSLLTFVMMKAYSQDLRDRVILTYKQGMHSRASLSRMFDVGYDTVCDWINRYEISGDYSSKQGAGCGRKQRFNDKESILQFIE